jgi:hypothetical protein
VKLTTHLHLVPRSRTCGAIPPFSNTPSWRGGELKKAQGQLYLYLHGRFVSRRQNGGGDRCGCVDDNIADILATSNKNEWLL